MADWEPQINVVDVTQIRDNLIEYIKANQVAALTWANAGRMLPHIKSFNISPRLVTVFPSLTLLQMEHESKWENDILEIAFAISMEVAIVHGNKDTLADRGPKYSMAMESMLSNVPETTFQQGSIIDITSTGMGAKTTFAVQEKYKTQFIEIFQTRASWVIEAAAFNA